MMRLSFRAALLAAAFACATPLAAHADTMRPEVGKPLQAARASMARGNYTAAMAQIHTAEAARNRTADENFTILQMRAAVAMGSHDFAAASRAYQDLLASGRLGAGEQQKVLMAQASMAYQQKNYAATITWIDKYKRAGGTSAEMNALLIQSYYLQGDFASAARLQANAINAILRAGHAPSEQDLQLLASCHDNLHNAAAFLSSMKLLVTYYPKPDYWAHLLHAVLAKPGFADRLQLDVLRFKLAEGLTTDPKDYFEAILLALQVPLPGEAQKTIDDAYAKGIFGTGPEAPRQQRLRDKVASTAKEIAKTLAADTIAAQTEHDGNHLFALAEITVADGKTADGIEMMKTAMARDGLTHPEDAKLHLALAYLAAGKKTDAVKMLRSVSGTDGAADIAQLWLLKIGH